MKAPYFFGYGSLVNRATHAYPQAQTATLSGWRRAWVRARERDDLVFLTAVADPAARISGLIAAVPNADWVALDTRETGYRRRDATDAVSHAATDVDSIAVYAIDPTDMRREGQHHILQSYLDVVVQGFLTEFGEEGVADFFATTSGWDTPILDDRAKPLYPRAQVLSTSEMALVDHHVARAKANL